LNVTTTFNVKQKPINPEITDVLEKCKLILSCFFTQSTTYRTKNCPSCGGSFNFCIEGRHCRLPWKVRIF